MSHDELLSLMRALLREHSKADLIEAICACHYGQLRQPITSENLHLFRRFRNTVSANPHTLIDAVERGYV